MIVFKRIMWKNLLSTGNVPVEIDLTGSKTTLICGKNGHGKSQIIDALVYGLYGRPFRKINKPQLVNSVNGRGMVVEIEFSINENNYKVVRGIKPHAFEIYANGQMIDQDSTVKDYQKMLEDQIMKISYASFVQIVILGSSSYIPFMRLPAHSRRNVIENILDISIFSNMANLLKDRKFDLGKQSLEAQKNLDLSKSLHRLKVEMDDKSKEDITQKKKDINGRLKTAVLQYQKHESSLDDFAGIDEEIRVHNATKKTAEQQAKKLNGYKIKIEQNLRRIRSKIKFYNENDTCPDCQQGIEHTHKHVQIKDLRNKEDQFKFALEDLTIRTKEQQDIIDQCETVVESFQKGKIEFHKITTLMETTKELIASLKKEIEEIEERPPVVSKSEIDQLKRDIKKFDKQLDDCERIAYLYGIIQTLLKDDGIKTKIIRYYLPVINKTVNKYLEKMQFIVNFTFDENFTEKILSRNRDDFSYFSFSEGEKSRIDLALLFTWREVAKRKNSTATNLLFLDEVFDSSLDNEGTDAFMEVISDEAEKSNIFIISHSSDVLQSKFDRTFYVKKEGNFSHYDINA